MEINNTAFVREIKPINVCGKTVMWQLSLDGVYSLPFEIKATTGIHDYEKCPQCQINIAQLTKDLIDRYEGTKKKKAFPFCCEMHQNLTKYSAYKKEDFKGVPNMVARKVIYTIQHFINVGNDNNWIKKYRDYFEWVMLSFGQMPHDCGEPLFLSAYIFHVESMVKRNKHIPEKNKPEIFKIIDEYRNVQSKESSNIHVLATVYEQWINTFPFELKTYFGDLKEKFTSKLLFVNGTPDINIYSGMSKVKIHTRESLVEALVQLTNKLLLEINGLTLYEKGLISNSNNLKLELAIEERRSQLKEGYIKMGDEEIHKYRKIIRKWFKDERNFFTNISTLIKSPSEVNSNAKQTINAPIIALFCLLVNDCCKSKRLESESILTYCKRICKQYSLTYTDRVRQGFYGSRNNRNIEQLKKLILPNIDTETRDSILKHLENKGIPNQKLYT